MHLLNLTSHPDCLWTLSSMFVSPLLLLSALQLLLGTALASPVRRGITRPRPSTVILDPGYMQRAASNPDQSELNTLKGLAERLLGAGPWAVTNKQKAVPDGTP